MRLRSPRRVARGAQRRHDVGSRLRPWCEALCASRRVDASRARLARECERSAVDRHPRHAECPKRAPRRGPRAPTGPPPTSRAREPARDRAPTRSRAAAARAQRPSQGERASPRGCRAASGSRSRPRRAVFSTPLEAPLRRTDCPRWQPTHGRPRAAEPRAKSTPKGRRAPIFRGANVALRAKPVPAAPTPRVWLQMRCRVLLRAETVDFREARARRTAGASA